MSLICYVLSRPFFQVQPFTEDFWDTVCFLRQRLRLYIHICFNVGLLFLGFSYPSSQYHALFLLFFPLSASGHSYPDPFPVPELRHSERSHNFPSSAPQKFTKTRVVVR